MEAGRCQLLAAVAPPLALAAVMWCTAVPAAWAQTPPDSPGGTCPSPHTRVEAKVRVAPPVIASDFTSGQISALARQNAQPLRHAAYGFYLARVFYQFTIHEVSGTPKGCAPEFEVAADLALADRHIEIASDLKHDTCVFPNALAHYRHHAEADERSFAKFAATVPSRIQEALADEAPGAPAGKETLRWNVGTAFDKVLRILDRSRQQAQAAVDSVSEVDRLTHPGCSV